jgi:hypothetical protein
MNRVGDALSHACHALFASHCGLLVTADRRKRHENRKAGVKGANLVNLALDAAKRADYFPVH